MPSPKCPSCSNHSFELNEIAVRNSKYKLYSVQCTSCGSVVSMLNYFDPGVLLKDQEQMLKDIQRGQEVINQNLRTIITSLNK